MVSWFGGWCSSWICCLGCSYYVNSVGICILQFAYSLLLFNVFDLCVLVIGYCFVCVVVAYSFTVCYDCLVCYCVLVFNGCYACWLVCLLVVGFVV